MRDFFIGGGITAYVSREKAKALPCAVGGSGRDGGEEVKGERSGGGKSEASERRVGSTGGAI